MIGLRRCGGILLSHKMEYYSAIKEQNNAIYSNMELETLILSEAKSEVEIRDFKAHRSLFFLKSQK